MSVMREWGMGDRNRDFESAIATSLIADLLDISGQPSVTVTILPINRFTVLVAP